MAVFDGTKMDLPPEKGTLEWYKSELKQVTQILTLVLIFGGLLLFVLALGYIVKDKQNDKLEAEINLSNVEKQELNLLLKTTVADHRKSLVERGCGRYNPKTGLFELICKVPE